MSHPLPVDTSTLESELTCGRKSARDTRPTKGKRPIILNVWGKLKIVHTLKTTETNQEQVEYSIRLSWKRR